MSHLNALRSFIAIYRSGTVSRAAAQLGLSQPAVSSHLQQLESLLGRPLFERLPRGVQPLPAAHELATRVGEPLDSLAGALAGQRARGTQLEGTVHLAGPPEFVGERAAPALRGLLDAGLQLVLHLGNRAQMRQWLSEGQVDLALMASAPRDRALGQQPLTQERLLLVGAPPLRAAARALKAADLQRLPLLAYDAELPLVREYCRAVLRFEPTQRPVALVPELRALRSLLIAGCGWSVLPDYLCTDALARGQLVQLGPPGPINGLTLVWRKAALQHPRVAFAREALLAAWPGA